MSDPMEWDEVWGTDFSGKHWFLRTNEIGGDRGEIARRRRKNSFWPWSFEYIWEVTMPGRNHQMAVHMPTYEGVEPTLERAKAQVLAHMVF